MSKRNFPRKIKTAKRTKNRQRTAIPSAALTGLSEIPRKQTLQARAAGGEITIRAIKKPKKKATLIPFLKRYNRYNVTNNKIQTRSTKFQ